MDWRIPGTIVFVVAVCGVLMLSLVVYVRGVLAATEREAARRNLPPPPRDVDAAGAAAADAAAGAAPGPRGGAAVAAEGAGPAPSAPNEDNSDRGGRAARYSAFVYDCTWSCFP